MGMAIMEMIAMIATTIISSTRVNPFESLVLIFGLMVCRLEPLTRLGELKPLEGLIDPFRALQSYFQAVQHLLTNRWLFPHLVHNPGYGLAHVGLAVQDLPECPFQRTENYVQRPGYFVPSLPFS